MFAGALRLYATPPRRPAGARHWLPASLRALLERGARRSWLDSLAARARSLGGARLLGHDDTLRAAAEANLEGLVKEHAHRVAASDEPALTHLRSACLAASSVRTLSPWLGADDAHRVAREFSGHNDVEEAIWGGMLTTAYALSPFKMRFLATRARLFLLDHGGALDARVEVTDSAVEATVASCLYRDVFEAEGCADGVLGAACCRSEVRRWACAPFVRALGVHVSAARRDDGACVLTWRRAAPRPRPG